MVIVGASLAGLRAAQALRADGFTGSLTIVGDEPHFPYDRPPLSKRTLTADLVPDNALPMPDGLDARWELGQPAVHLDTQRGAVTLGDGTRLAYDGVLVATGSTARGWHDPRSLPERGVLTLRTRDDALRLRAELPPGHKLVVVGAGFLGGEIAAAARARGVDVTLVEAASQPLERAIGAGPGAYMAELHREAGIDLRTGTTVADFRATGGRLTGVRLSDDSELPADVAVLALGAAPATAWLAGSSLDIGNGVRCDIHLRALTADGAVVPGVVAAGDVARVPHHLAGGAPIVLGHWSNAVEQGTAAAHTLLKPDDPRPFTGVPTFWSDLHDARIRSVGLPALADEVRVHEHDLAGRHLEVGYHRAGKLVGALTVGRTGRLTAYRHQLERDAWRARAATEPHRSPCRSSRS
ncbi:NAD(P)/FAD-dependent oxidoreductase [Nonomuraea terrae]|uniref:NAD(P)/FAD-dependent oxidoreductase n=1 Tax=Nonomuraea terrae TaxID=2530383 RepID=A0A4R4ZC54_9ACTN|nr:NAD(P)/FAD-dependent oxidoreductase [Nonomuraea terrae]